MSSSKQKQPQQVKLQITVDNKRTNNMLVHTNLSTETLLCRPWHSGQGQV